MFAVLITYITQERATNSSLIEMVKDARRFIMFHKWAIESSPLQAYVSALIFSPTHSLTRNLFEKEELKGIVTKPGMQDIWSSCLTTLEGHRSVVYSVVFSHDSNRLASASYDRTVKVWDASSGECLWTLKGHSSAVTSVTFSRDSTWLASASRDCTVKVWDTSSGGECLWTLKGHSSTVTSVTFSHDSTWLASASHDCTVKVWDTSSGGECLWTLKGHSSAITSVTFSHDSTWLASASRDCTVKVWDTSSGGECLWTLEGHSSAVTSVTFSHDSTWLASASYDRTVKVWDASSGGECLWTLKGHSSAVTSVTFSHDSTWLASASYDRTVKVWDTSSGECLLTLKVKKMPHYISFGNNNLYLQSDVGAIDISTLSKSRPFVASPEPQSPQYEGLALSADNLWITCDSKNTIWLPPEYRRHCSAVSGNIVVIGTGSGKCGFIIFCVVHPRDLSFYVDLIYYSILSISLRSIEGKRSRRTWLFLLAVRPSPTLMIVI
jgi:WD40 repeat protein